MCDPPGGRLDTGASGHGGVGRRGGATVNCADEVYEGSASALGYAICAMVRGGLRTYSPGVHCRRHPGACAVQTRSKGERVRYCSLGVRSERRSSAVSPRSSLSTAPWCGASTATPFAPIPPVEGPAPQAPRPNSSTSSSRSRRGIRGSAVRGSRAIWPAPSGSGWTRTRCVESSRNSIGRMPAAGAPPCARTN